MKAEPHGFRPVNDPEAFEQAINYIAAKAKDLVELFTGREIPMDTLTIFAQNDDELNFLTTHLKALGPVSDLSHGKTLYVKQADLQIQNQHIRYLGVRAPDTLKPQVGYADFPVDSLERIGKSLAKNEFVKAVKSGSGKDLLELKHPDFDVLGYIVERK